MTRLATAAEHADHNRGLRKHDWRPGDPLPFDQRCALSELVGYCEGLANSGLLREETELNLRRNIAKVCVAFHLPSEREKSDA